MADRSVLTLAFGTWVDEGEGVDLRRVASVHFSDLPEPDMNALVAKIRDWGLSPWDYKRNYHFYFANASSDSLQIIVAVAPLIAMPIWNGAVQAIAEYLAAKLLSLFGGSSEWKMEDAEEVARRVLVWSGGVSPTDMRQTLAKRNDDGSFMFLYEHLGKEEDHLVLVDDRGVSAHVNVTALSTALDAAHGKQGSPTRAALE